MRADAFPVEKIFDIPIQYWVPLYQRPYVWKEDIDNPSDDRLTPFWEDVRDTVNRYLRREEHLAKGVKEHELAPFADHFFGAVVLGEPDRSFGGIPHQEVIDGQQRFTTAQLIIAAAERLAETNRFAGLADALRDLRFNASKHDPKPDELHKLWPTNVNRVAYAAVMAPGGPLPVPDDPKNRIQEAYDFFAAELAEWLAAVEQNDRERHVRALQRVLRSHLKFVIIELEVGDNAQEIFESLNAQGTPLLAVDLVKNYVFRRAAAPDADIDLDELDQKVWRALDAPWWRQEQRQGRFIRPRVELFLMHWLTVRERDEVPASGLFVEFQREALPATLPDSEIRAFVEQFIADAELYRSLSAQPAGSLPRRFLNRLDLLDTTTLYPVILWLFMAERDGTLTVEDRDDVLTALESWIVRRMICGYTSKNYNRTTVELLRRIAATPGQPRAVVIRYLRDADTDTETWPGDSLLQNVLVEQPLYNRVKPVRRVRMLLEACEIELRAASGGYTEIKQQVAPELDVKLTVEHILPQKWRKNWSVGAGLPDDQRTELEAERDAHVHRLGNLTLLTKALNPSISNGAWKAKRDALKQHSVLYLNRDLVNEHEESWSEADIDVRGAVLAELIARHWRGPDHWAGV